jgi:uncharacterized protein (TIGR02231 family)
MVHLLALVLAASLGEAGATLPSRIADVTVFPGGALVRRTADVPAGGGSVTLEGLPATLDPDSVRARCAKADVVGVEVRERVAPALPDARAEELRSRVRAVERELAALRDEADVERRVEAHLGRLLALEEERRREALRAGSFEPDAWRATLRALSEETLSSREREREIAWKIADAEQRLLDAQLEFGNAGGQRDLRLRDVIVEVVEGAPATSLEVEYAVTNAGWRPMYDLRVARDAKSVDLVYRAQVWQRSGEDWGDVGVALSTARPMLGAQGPEPSPRWLSIEDASAKRYRGRAAPRPSPRAAEASEDDRSLGDEGAFGYGFSATVESEGLSVRFRLPIRQTIPSRDEPATVLIGEARLALAPEYYATPSMDSNVWLRGVAINSSEWTLLPGSAAVYFGADFLGHSEIESVQPAEELTLHLGPDPALAIEREKTADRREGAGVFGSRASQEEGFAVHVKNHGALVCEPDGTAVVLVREALPRSTDERVKVDLAESKPKPSEEQRWKRDRDEKGIATWLVRVPRGGEATLEYLVRISYPERLELVR